MLDRVRQIGNKGHGRSALETQRDSYLDILTCISLIEDESDIDGNNDPNDWLNMLRNARVTSEADKGRFYKGWGRDNSNLGNFLESFVIL